jgi:hypothetical protein
MDEGDVADVPRFELLESKPNMTRRSQQVEIFPLIFICL